MVAELRCSGWGSERSMMEARLLRWRCRCTSLLMRNHNHLDQHLSGNLQVEDIRDRVAPITSYFDHMALLECEFLCAPILIFWSQESSNMLLHAKIINLLFEFLLWLLQSSSNSPSQKEGLMR